MNPEANQKPMFPGYDLDENNPILDVLMSHRSIRKFKEKPLPEKAIAKIISAAQRASTSCNYQSYSIIVVDSLPLRERLREVSGNQPFVSECGSLLIFCADISRLVYSCSKQGYPFRGDQIDMLLSAHGDALIACQNAAIAAESMGFGICMLGNIRNHPQAVSDLLGLPQYVFATVGLAVGYPDETPSIKPRLPMRAIVSHDKYNTDFRETDLCHYDQVMCNSGVYHNRMQPLCDEASGRSQCFTEKNYGWIEHTARRLSGRIQDQRRNFASFLECKGFSLK